MIELKRVAGEEGTALVMLTGPRGYYVELVDVDTGNVLFVKIAPTRELADAAFEEAL